MPPSSATSDSSMPPPTCWSPPPPSSQRCARPAPTASAACGGRWPTMWRLCVGAARAAGRRPPSWAGPRRATGRRGAAPPAAAEGALPAVPLRPRRHRATCRAPDAGTCCSTTRRPSRRSTAATACARPAPPPRRRAHPPVDAHLRAGRRRRQRAPPLLPGPARADGSALAAETAGDSADRADRRTNPAGLAPAQPTWAPATSMPAPAGTSAMSITLCRWCTPAGSSTARRAAATASTAVACDCRRLRAQRGAVLAAGQRQPAVAAVVRPCGGATRRDPGQGGQRGRRRRAVEAEVAAHGHAQVAREHVLVGEIGPVQPAVPGRAGRSAAPRVVAHALACGGIGEPAASAARTTTPPWPPRGARRAEDEGDVDARDRVPPGGRRRPAGWSAGCQADAEHHRRRAARSPPHRASWR